MTTTTELTLPQRAAVALGAAEHEKKLALMAEEAKTITEIKNKDGREQCHSMMMSLKNARITIEKTGKAAREDAQAFANAVIAEQKRLIAITEAEELRLQGLRDQWDADREAERLAKIEAERKRVEAIRARINELERTPLLVVGQPSVVIDRIIQSFIDEQIDESFEEFLPEAQAAHAKSLQALQDAMQAAIKAEVEAAERARQQEAEAARLKAEREELARLRAEAEARRAEDERIAAEKRAAEEAAMQAERDRLAAERAELERQQAEINAAREAEERRIAEIHALEEAERAAESKAATSAMNALSEARAAESMPGEVLDQLESVTTGLIADMAIARAATASKSAPLSAPTLRLGQIGERLGFAVTADFLTSLGFAGERIKGAVLFQESDFPRICAALVNHIHAVQQRLAA